MTSRYHRIAVLSAVLLLAISMPLLSGDEVAENAAVPAAVDAAAEAIPESPPADESILTLVLGTGLTGIAFITALGLFSLVAVTVAIERLFNTRRECIVPAGFISELQKVVESERSTPKDLKAICDRHNVPAATILLAGVQRSGRPFSEIEKAMEDAAAREMGTMRSRVRPLTVAGSVTPLIGLLGTVVGMIIAFKTASQAGLGKGEMLAQGIYMALVTTAAGLLIAIPSMLCAAYFNGKLEKYFREIDAALMMTYRCFSRVEQGMVNPPLSYDTGEPARERSTDKVLTIK
ncbi:MAG: MotA/TolQ/ExbB proton channel family protein [Planctomycetota bacterium]|nr:MotA/TolQ/ExbB proton channel family protein [Planctomycetota bacterium]